MSARKLVFDGATGDRLAVRLELPVGEEPVDSAVPRHESGYEMGEHEPQHRPR